MTVSAAPSQSAPQASAQAEPSAVARATPETNAKPNRLPADPFAAAKQEMRSKVKDRKMRLVDDRDTAKPIHGDVATDEPATPDGDNATADDTTDDAQDATEKEPTWAQKLREDLSKKTAEVEQAKQADAKREQQWARAVQSAKNHVEDITGERDHYKGLFEQAKEYLVANGMMDPMSVDLVSEQYERRKLERLLARGTSAQTEEGKASLVRQHTESIGAGLNPLMQKYPELNPKKNPEAIEFLEMALAKYRTTGKFDDNLEDRARRWVAGWRASRTQEPAAQKPAAPKPRAPESTTLAGVANSGRPAKSTVKGLAPALTKKQLIDEVNARRAARQQR